MLLSQAPFSCFAARSRPTLFSKIQSSEGYSYFWVSLLFICPFYLSFLSILFIYPFYLSFLSIRLSVPSSVPSSVRLSVPLSVRPGLAQLSINHQKQYLPLRFSILHFFPLHFSLFAFQFPPLHFSIFPFSVFDFSLFPFRFALLDFHF